MQLENFEITVFFFFKLAKSLLFSKHLCCFVRLPKVLALCVFMCVWMDIYSISEHDVALKIRVGDQIDFACWHRHAISCVIFFGCMHHFLGLQRIRSASLFCGHTHTALNQCNPYNNLCGFQFQVPRVFFFIKNRRVALSLLLSGHISNL